MPVAEYSTNKFDVEAANKTKAKRLTLEVPQAHSALQRAYVESRAPITVAAMGTKWGKTFSTCRWMVERAWTMGLGPSRPHWWVAPIYKQARIAMNTMRAFLPTDESRVRFLKSDNRVEIYKSNGQVHSVIEFRSAERPDDLQGEAIASGVCDEADRMSEEAFNSFYTTCTQSQAPLKIISSPKRRRWFYRYWLKGRNITSEQRVRLWQGDRTATKDGIISYNCPTGANPFVPQESIDRAKSNLPARVFRAYYLAEFPEEEGIVFGNISQVFKPDMLLEPMPVLSETYILAADLAKHEDYTFISVWSVQRRKVVWMEEWKDLSWEMTLRKIAVLGELYNNADIIMDQTGLGDPLVEQIRNFDIPCNVEGYVFNNQSKRAVIDGLTLGIEKKDFSIPSAENNAICQRAKEELETYEFEISEAGNIKYDAAEGFDCDAVISLGLGYWYLSNQATPGLRVLTSSGKQEKTEVTLLSPEQIQAKQARELSKFSDGWRNQEVSKLTAILNKGDDND